MSELESASDIFSYNVSLTSLIKTFLKHAFLGSTADLLNDNLWERGLYFHKISNKWFWWWAWKTLSSICMSNVADM